MARIDRASLAHRIKARRLELGLTQRAVAGEDFTRGFISQIENGLIDPSLKSLEIIAQRLGIPVSQFLSQADPVDPVVVEDKIKRVFGILNDDLDEAERASKEALEGAEQLDNPALLARAKSASAWVHYKRKEYGFAYALFCEAAENHRRAGYTLLASRAFNAAGAAAHLAGCHEDAEASYEAALQCARSSDEPSPIDILRIEVNLGLLRTQYGDIRKGIKQLENVIRREDEYKDYYRYAQVQDALGLAYRKIGDTDKSIHHHLQARIFSQAVNEQLSYAHATLNCGITYAAKKDYQQARLHLEEALGLYEALQQAASAANAHAELAHVAWQEGNTDLANEHCNAALASLSDGRERGRMLLLHGRILEQQADLPAALNAYTEGLNLLDKFNDHESTEACFALGNLLLRLGRAEDASVYLARAATFYRNMSH